MNNTLHACVSLKFRRELTKHDVLSCECYPTFKDKDLKTQRGQVTCPSHIVNVGQFDSETDT